MYKKKKLKRYEMFHKEKRHLGYNLPTMNITQLWTEYHLQPTALPVSPTCRPAGRWL